MRTKPSTPSKSTPSKKNPAKRPAHEQQQPAPTIPEQKDSQEEKTRQQTLLDVFSTAFRDVLHSPDFTTRLQEVKTALYNRDFEAAFAHESALAVYAARWSPTRALCYGHILRELDAHLKTLITASGPPGSNGEGAAGSDNDDPNPTTDPAPSHPQVSASETKDTTPEGTPDQRTLKVLSIGGAAAELVAVADYIASTKSQSQSQSQPQTTTTTITPEITLLDIAPWTPTIKALTKTLTTPPARSPLHPTDKPPLLPTPFHPRVSQTNILTADVKAVLSAASGPGNPAVLITLLFTLNELYTTSGTKPTTTFLRALTAHAPPGSLLLVVDSPGSYAETAVGKEGRRYPMQWLLHHTLVPPSGSQSGSEGEEEKRARWERIESHDSIWFRVAEGLRYPIPLENMRYQLHLYRANTGS
ncbi:hypothetical protein F4861DRAFT_127437 [Xylaria intraflava]|nr:hypothetical protein F4861DRAFT_127437 [Xylaria intraflava]